MTSGPDGSVGVGESGLRTVDRGLSSCSGRSGNRVAVVEDEREGKRRERAASVRCIGA